MQIVISTNYVGTLPTFA